MAQRYHRRAHGCGSWLMGCLSVILAAAALTVAAIWLVPSVRVGFGKIADPLRETIPALDEVLPFEQRQIPSVEEIQEDGLAFAALTDEQKVLYQQLLDGVNSCEETFEVLGATPDDIDPAYHAVLIDHPELFWVDGSTRYSYFADGGPITVTPGLTLSLDDVGEVRQSIEEVADAFLATIPPDADEYTKAQLAYEYVIGTTDYDVTASQNQNIQSVLLGHASVCAGYARAYQYLLMRAGMSCSFVEGTIPSTGEDHAWNIVRIDGAYTYVDPTWGDPTYPGLDEGEAGTVYDYLGLTTAEVLRDDHTFADESLWPLCESNAANYYVRHGLVLDSADEAVLSDAFWRQQASGANPVVFKFSTEEAYVQARGQLEVGELLVNDLVSLFETQGRMSTSYQYQYGDALYILKLFL